MAATHKPRMLGGALRMSVSETDALSGTRSASRSKRRAWIARAKQIALLILKEPLVHFIVAGALLFAAGHIYEQQTSIYRIVLTPRHVAQLGNDYALQFGTQPDAQTLDALIRRDVHDEIL